MDPSYVEELRRRFKKVVASGQLSTLSTEAFIDKAYSNFIQNRNIEMLERVEKMNQSNILAHHVRNPDGGVSNIARPQFNVDQNLIKEYADKYFWKDPPTQYLRDDAILHMFYAPKHFLTANTGTNSAEERKLLDLIAEMSNLRDADTSGLNSKEIRDLGL